jgi:tRNA (guanine-N7-)-methyltransferase
LNPHCDPGDACRSNNSSRTWCQGGRSPDPLPPIDWTNLFGNNRDVEIEVGFGKGLFLVTAAAAQPNINFFGIEILRKYQLYAATRIAKRGLTNVRLACADARILLRDCVPEASVAAVHVYFPDPWWKKRHHKRRLCTPEFAASIARVLRPAGHFHIVSDVSEYIAVVGEIVSGLPLLQSAPALLPNGPRHDMDYLTNFERKFRKEGRAIYRAAFVKIAT